MPHPPLPVPLALSRARSNGWSFGPARLRALARLLEHAGPRWSPLRQQDLALVASCSLSTAKRAWAFARASGLLRVYQRKFRLPSGVWRNAPSRVRLSFRFLRLRHAHARSLRLALLRKAVTPIPPYLSSEGAASLRLTRLVRWFARLSGVHPRLIPSIAA